MQTNDVEAPLLCTMNTTYNTARNRAFASNQAKEFEGDDIANGA